MISAKISIKEIIFASFAYMKIIITFRVWTFFYWRWLWNQFYFWWRK